MRPLKKRGGPDSCITTTYASSDVNNSVQFLIMCKRNSPEAIYKVNKSKRKNHKTCTNIMQNKVVYTVITVIVIITVITTIIMIPLTKLEVIIKR
jgi:hypothetical protein